jgi:Methyltransferase domain
MAGALTWQSDERCVVGDLTFQILPGDLLDRPNPTISMEGADFLLFKEPPLIDWYVELIEALQPRNVVELGIMEGGGTALLYSLAHPARLVAIDRRAPMDPTLRDYVAREGVGETVRIYDDVDQADRRRLAEIVDEEFGDRPLDLVVDDCSHLYDPTRASFNELFPRLRPGGVYTIEDWPWAHEEPVADMWADQVPLTRMALELVLANPVVPDLLSEVTIDPDVIRIVRGDAEVDPIDFDISKCIDEAGGELLAKDERVHESARASKD